MLNSEPLDSDNIAADVEEVQVTADVDVRAREGDPVEHIERIQVAASRDRRTGQDRVESDPVDRRRATGDERSREDSVLESLDVADLTAIHGDLADVEDVTQIRLAVGEALGEALVLLFSERVDRQLGILGRAIDDDPDSPAGHRIGTNGADRLRIVGGCLGDQRRQVVVEVFPSWPFDPSAMLVARVLEVYERLTI